MSHRLVRRASNNWVPQTFRRRPYLKLLNIFYFSKKQLIDVYVKQEVLHLKNTFFIKSSIFVLVPWETLEGPLEIPDVGTFRGPSGDVLRTLRAGWVTASLLSTASTSLRYWNKIADVLNKCHCILLNYTLELLCQYTVHHLFAYYSFWLCS